MKIVVCVRQGLDGEINPFDACAYESALQVGGADITLISMGPLSAKDFLTSLTRLGANRAILLSDSAFAGADTLATAYALGMAIRKINPDYVFCGRQTLVGDTAQTGVMLSVNLCCSLITNVMEISDISGEKIVCQTRSEGEKTAHVPALITVERINDLRLPSLRSKSVECEVWSANDIAADIEKCGLKGSPTRVISTHENTADRRHCKFVEPSQFTEVINLGLQKRAEQTKPQTASGEKIDKVFVVGKAPMAFALTVADRENITVIDFDSDEKLAEIIDENRPKVVLWGSDDISKRLAAQVSARLGLGLCADCTALETDGEQLFMIRPALSGSVIAKIKSQTVPAMATVRTAETDTPDIIIAAGYGAKDNLAELQNLAQRLNAGFAASRKMVDNGILPYNLQVGLTGRTVSPPVYVAVGVSGAVHHIAGMKRSGTVIAVNPDKKAPIFDYADYGIVADISDIL